MRTFLIFVIACNGLGFIFASNIDSDLAEQRQLFEQFKKYTPDIGRRFFETTCQMISECCPQFKSTFLSVILKGDAGKITTECFSGNNSLANMLACPSLGRLSTMIQNPELTKYLSIIDTIDDKDNDYVEYMLDTCSTDEINAIYCNWYKADAADACARKIYEKWARDGAEVYKKKLQTVKQDDMKLVDELKAAFNH